MSINYLRKSFICDVMLIKSKTPYKQVNVRPKLHIHVNTSGDWFNHLYLPFNASPSEYEIKYRLEIVIYCFLIELMEWTFWQTDF